MKNKSLTLSIVIPVYNEERYLKACLGAIANQTVKPDEVIVVDNNSTDSSMEIARHYKFVKILYEKRQHQVFAQKRGFDAAKSDVLGRIDADTILPKDWAANVINYFSENPGTVAITGSALPYDVKMHRFARSVFRFYNWLASALGGVRMLWGANCAIRASAWKKIESNVLLRGDIWEDQDMSFWLKSIGRVAVVKNTDVGTSFRVVHSAFIKQARYQFRSIRTFYLHKGVLVATVYGILWFTMIPLYIVVLFDSYVLKPLTNFKEPY